MTTRISSMMALCPKSDNFCHYLKTPFVRGLTLLFTELYTEKWPNLGQTQKKGAYILEERMCLRFSIKKNRVDCTEVRQKQHLNH
jgi:hypothetical protein